VQRPPGSFRKDADYAHGASVLLQLSRIIPTERAQLCLGRYPVIPFTAGPYMLLTGSLRGFPSLPPFLPTLSSCVIHFTVICRPLPRPAVPSPFWATVCETVRPMLSDRCHVCLPALYVCNVGVLWQNGWMYQDKTSHSGRPQPRPHCIRWGPSTPPPKRGTTLNVQPISIAAKRRDGLRCHLVWR